MVAGQVVLATGNENLGTGNVEGAVVVGHRLGTQNAQVGARMRLGEAHGGQHLPRCQLGHDPCALILGSEAFQDPHRARHKTSDHLQ